MDIVDIVFKKNERLGPQATFRTMICDLTCTGPEGEQLIVEMQQGRQPYFKDRALYYVSCLNHAQPPKGGGWDYNLKQVYFIALMDFNFDDTHPEKYLHHVQLKEDKRSDPSGHFEKNSFNFEKHTI